MNIYPNLAAAHLQLAGPSQSAAAAPPLLLAGPSQPAVVISQRVRVSLHPPFSSKLSCTPKVTVVDNVPVPDTQATGRRNLRNQCSYCCCRATDTHVRSIHLSF